MAGLDPAYASSWQERNTSETAEKFQDARNGAQRAVLAQFAGERP